MLITMLQSVLLIIFAIMAVCWMVSIILVLIDAILDTYKSIKNKNIKP